MSKSIYDIYLDICASLAWGLLSQITLLPRLQNPSWATTHNRYFNWRRCLLRRKIHFPTMRFSKQATTATTNQLSYTRRTNNARTKICFCRRNVVWPRYWRCCDFPRGGENKFAKETKWNEQNSWLGIFHFLNKPPPHHFYHVYRINR